MSDNKTTKGNQNHNTIRMGYNYSNNNEFQNPNSKLNQN